MLDRNRVNVGLYINNLPYSIPAQIPIEAGTIMLFQQTNAPIGWTKLLTQNDKALRVVTGTASSGGASSFTTVFSSQSISTTNTIGATTLDSTRIPLHTHPNGSPGVNKATGCGCGGSHQNAGAINTASSSSPIGGGQSHTHAITGVINASIDLSIQYVDIIMAYKN